MNPEIKARLRDVGVETREAGGKLVTFLMKDFGPVSMGYKEGEHTVWHGEIRASSVGLGDALVSLYLVAKEK